MFVYRPDFRPIMVLMSIVILVVAVILMPDISKPSHPASAEEEPLDLSRATAIRDYVLNSWDFAQFVIKNQDGELVLEDDQQMLEQEEGGEKPLFVGETQAVRYLGVDNAGREWVQLHFGFTGAYSIDDEDLFSVIIGAYDMTSEELVALVQVDYMGTETEGRIDLFDADGDRMMVDIHDSQPQIVYSTFGTDSLDDQTWACGLITVFACITECEKVCYAAQPWCTGVCGFICSLFALWVCDQADSDAELTATSVVKTATAQAINTATPNTTPTATPTPNCNDLPGAVCLTCRGGQCIICRTCCEFGGCGGEQSDWCRGLTRFCIKPNTPTPVSTITPVPGPTATLSYCEFSDPDVCLYCKNPSTKRCFVCLGKCSVNGPGSEWCTALLTYCEAKDLPKLGPSPTAWPTWFPFNTPQPSSTSTPCANPGC